MNYQSLIFSISMIIFINLASADSTSTDAYLCNDFKNYINSNLPAEQKAQRLMRILRYDNGDSCSIDISNKIDHIKGPVLPYSKNHIFNILSSKKLLLSKSDKITNESKFIKNWSSGGSNHRSFSDAKLNLFFKEIFFRISNRFENISLSLLDLFHGHIIIDSSSVSYDDILIIFHAKEYPKDLESYKVNFALEKYPYCKTFTTSSKGYESRNLIWSLRKNIIWRLDTSKASVFSELVKSPVYDFAPELVLKANALQENFFGETLLNINYFNDENANNVILAL